MNRSGLGSGVVGDTPEPETHRSDEIGALCSAGFTMRVGGVENRIGCTLSEGHEGQHNASVTIDGPAGSAADHSEASPPFLDGAWVGPWRLGLDGMWRRHYRRMGGGDVIAYGPLVSDRSDSQSIYEETP